MSNPNEAPGNAGDSKERQRASIKAAKKCLAEAASIKDKIKEMEIDVEALELEAKAHLIRANVRPWRIRIHEMSPDLISGDEEWIKGIWQKMIVAAGGNMTALTKKFGVPEIVGGTSLSDLSEIEKRTSASNLKRADEFIEKAALIKTNGTYVWQVRWNDETHVIFATEETAASCVEKLERMAEARKHWEKGKPTVTKQRVLIDEFNLGMRKQMAEGRSEALILKVAESSTENSSGPGSLMGLLLQMMRDRVEKEADDIPVVENEQILEQVD